MRAAAEAATARELATSQAAIERMDAVKRAVDATLAREQADTAAAAARTTAAQVRGAEALAQESNEIDLRNAANATAEAEYEAARAAEQSAASEQRLLLAAQARERAELAALAEAETRIVRERELVAVAEQRRIAEAAAQDAEQAHRDAADMLAAAATQRSMGPDVLPIGMQSANDEREPDLGGKLREQPHSRPASSAHAPRRALRSTFIVALILLLGAGVGYGVAVLQPVALEPGSATGASGEVVAAVPNAEVAAAAIAGSSGAPGTAASKVVARRWEIPATLEEPVALKLDRSIDAVAQRGRRR